MKIEIQIIEHRVPKKAFVVSPERRPDHADHNSEAKQLQRATIAIAAWVAELPA
jgi:hypothetical protein